MVGKGGPIGNQKGVKLKDPEIRQLAYKQFCDWIASGMPKESFFFKHGNHSACWETVESYAEKYPSEFLPILMKEAEAKRYALWFGEGNKLMKGQYEKGSPVVWQTIMRNMFKKYKWDQKELEDSNKPTEQVHFAIAQAKELHDSDSHEQKTAHEFKRGERSH